MSSRKTRALGNVETCKSHLTKCEEGEKCTMKRRNPGEECDCLACKIEKKQEAKVWTCPGHPCVENGHINMYLRNLVVKGARGAYPVKGEFNSHRNTPRDNDYWDLKTDGSCGWELVTPPMTGLEVPALLGPVLESINEGLVFRKAT